MTVESANARRPTQRRPRRQLHRGRKPYTIVGVSTPILKEQMDEPASLRDREKQVHRSLLGNQIADALRRDILLGRVKAGTRLSQQQLCATYGTSRMPVRDGLRVLANEGLLVNDSGRHAIVAPLSRADMLDSYLIEGTLAGIAAERASANATDEDLESLYEQHRQMAAAAGRADYAESARLNWGLHRTINRLAKSRKLLSAIKAVSLDLPRDFLIELPEWGQKSILEHEAILTSMTNRWHSQAGSLMTEHIVDSGRGLISYLESQGLELD